MTTSSEFGACPKLDELAQLLDSESSAPLDGRWNAHLAQCEACRGSMDTFRANLRMEADIRRLLPARGGSSDVVLSLTAPPFPIIEGFTIVGERGRGGMGVVYEAIQESPRRVVALKITHADAPFDRHLRLIEREAGALARLQHGNIASLYEVGRSRDRRPWFAMEFVNGVRLKDDPKICAITVCEIVRLFLPIVDAISYAHQRGVIHRDIKPSNIMIRTDGVAKVLDFGLAKFGADGAASDLSLTAAGNLRGTLPYMSPEQASGENAEVDVRSDIYSLGVVLYELLCGQLPYEVSNGDLLRSVRTICEVQPIAPRKLNAAIPRDLEAVLLKALAKAPAARYASAASLADDLERVLTGHPISAKPLTAAYQLRVFIRRHRLVATLSGIIATLTIVYTLATTYLLNQSRAHAASAQAARGDAVVKAKVAEQQAQRATRVTQLLADVFRGADPKYGGVPSLPASALLERGATAALQNVTDEPLTKAALLHVLGDSFRHLGEWNRARAMLLESLDLWRQYQPENAYQVGSTLVSLAELEELAGNASESTRYFRDAYEIMGNRLPTVDLHLLTALRGALKNTEDWVELESVCRVALASPAFAAAPAGQRIGWQNQLAEALDQQGRYDDAISVMHDAIESIDELPESYREDVRLTVQGNLAWLLLQVDELAEAETLATTVLQERRKRLPPTHLELSTTLLTLGVTKSRLGQGDDALPLLEECLSIRAAALPPEDARVVEAQQFLDECRAGQK